jgi:hypothetical protein
MSDPLMVDKTGKKQCNGFQGREEMHERVPAWGVDCDFDISEENFEDHGEGVNEDVRIRCQDAVGLKDVSV